MLQNKYVRSREEIYAEIMEEALLRVTKNQLKPEIAVRVAWKISTTINHDDEMLMHQAPTSRAERFASRIKDEYFVNGENVLRR